MDQPVTFYTMRETIGIPALVGPDAWWIGRKRTPSSICTQTAPRRPCAPEEIRQQNLCSGLLLGQVLSVLIALASMSAASLDDRGVNLPSFLNLMNYSFITLAFFVPMVLRPRPLKLPWWRYALYALVSICFSFG